MKAQPRLAVFSSNGEVLLASPSVSGYDDQYVRLTSAGAARWTVSLRASPYYPNDLPMGMLANADGSAFLATGDSLHLAKINADGSVAWTRTLSAHLLAALSDQTIVVGGCNGITAVDAASGDTVWEYSFPYPSRDWSVCSLNGIVSDGNGNTYATFSTFLPASITVNGFHTLRLGSTGQIVWDQSTPAAVKIVPVGVGSALLYTNEGSDVHAYATGDGSSMWVSTNALGLATAGTPAELIVESNGQIQRLRNDTGQPLWSQTGPGANPNPYTPNIVSVVNGAILLGVGGNAPQLEKLDLETGELMWTMQLPPEGSYGYTNFFATGQMADGNLLAVAKLPDELNDPFWQFPVAYPPLLQRVSFSDGQLLDEVPAPLLAQGLRETTILDDPQHIAAVSVVPGPNGTNVHVRRLNATDGSIAWENVDSSQPLHIPPANYVSILTAGDALVIAVPQNVPQNNETYGSLWIEAFDRSTGAKHWGRWLGDPYQPQGPIEVSDPVSDPAGNIFVAYGTTYLSNSFGQVEACPHQTIAKLSGTDGSTFWQFDNQSSYCTFGYSPLNDPQSFALLDSDLLVGAQFYGPYASAAIIRLSGADGSLMWSSTIPSDNYGVNIYPVDDGNVLVDGLGGRTKLDGVTGTPLWTNSIVENTGCIMYTCYDYDNLTLPGGDLLLVGENNSQPRVTLMPSSENTAMKIWSLEPNDPYLRSRVMQVKSDSSGGIWMRLNRNSLNGIFVANILAQFDVHTGALLSQQILYAANQTQLNSSTRSILLSPPENNRLLVWTTVVDPPSPTTDGNAMLDTTILANGDLSLQATTDNPVVTAGQVQGFHIVATYTGDNPVSGVHLIGVLPSTGHVTGLSCATQAASNCVIEDSRDGIQVSFDMQPGGRIDVSGQIVVSTNLDTAVLNAMIYGPISLNESNTVNNFARAAIREIIFANGFE